MIFWPRVYLMKKKTNNPNKEGNINFSRISEKMLLTERCTRILEHFPSQKRTGFKNRTRQRIEYGIMIVHDRRRASE